MNRVIKTNKKYTKYIVVLFLLLFMVVGFALLSSTLNINGVSKISGENWKIYFDHITYNEGNVELSDGDAPATIKGEDKNSIDYSVTFGYPGEFYEFTVDVVNEGSLDGIVNLVTSTMSVNGGESTPIDEDNLPSYLTYSLTYLDGSKIDKDHILRAGSSETYKVRVGIKEDIDESELPSLNATYNFSLGVTYEQTTSDTSGMVKYKVIHKTMNFEEGSYSVKDQEVLFAKANTQVSPDTKTYQGFTSPQKQTITVNQDGSSTVEYLYERNKYTLTLQDSEYIETTTGSGEYYYDTKITLKAKDREGLSFVKWSNDLTDQEITFKLKDNVTIKPIYQSNIYTVTFNSNGGEVSPTTRDVTIGNTIGELPVPVRSGYYLDGWYLDLASGTAIDSSYIPESDIELFAKWKVSVASMVIANENISVDTGDSETIDITNASQIEEEYTFASDDDNIATVDANGVVTGVGEGNTIITITGVNSHDIKTVNVSVTQGVTEYVVTFNANGGEVSEASRNVVAGQAIGNLPEPTKANNKFDGWFTALSGGTEVDSSYIPQGDVEIFARWTEYICVRADSLHTATCTDGSCTSAGYSNGDTITFGNISTGTFEYGNAYDCKVTTTGGYTERFYYVGDNGNNAALIYYTNYEGNAIGLGNSYSYNTAVTKLPKATDWNNIVVTFGDNNDRAARFILPSEYESACNMTIGSSTTGETDGCQYVMENSRFVSTATGRTGIWLEHTTDLGYVRIHTKNRNVNIVAETSENVARPVIEVSKDQINNTIDPSSMVTISFDTQGGDAVSPVSKVKNASVGTLPNATKLNYTFDGWYTDANYTTPVTESTVFSQDTTVVAKWKNLEGAAVVNGVGYTTLAAAVTAVTGSTKTTIYLLKDLDTNVTIPSGKNIVLDLQGFTLTKSGTAISNAGTLEITNGTVNGTGNDGTINNTGTLKITDGAIISATGGKQAIYNNGGTLEINGTAQLSSVTSNRATVHNLNNGTTNIVGGTIISSGAYAVYNESGTLNIGVSNGVVDITTPVIKGQTYGVIGYSNYNFYDGIIEGKTYPVGNATSSGTTPSVSSDLNKTKIANKEVDSTYIEDTDGDYNTLYLHMDVDKYLVIFHPNGGELVETSRAIEQGSAVGELPVPTKGIYTFDGWYTGLDSGVQIDENEIPTGNVTYYAHWIYSSSDEVVNYNMSNAPLDVYYANIGTWKNDQSTFQTNMDNNFNNYTCSSCTGPKYQDCPTPAANTKLCDQPDGYSTGTNTDLNVYLSDENTKVIDKTKLVTYTTSENGVIYNMIPGETYYWEANNDSDVHGFVKATGNRRLITTTVRNVRDIGGLEVDTDNDGVVDGTLKYGKIFRGAKLSSTQIDATNLEKLGITTEIDLRSSSDGANDAKISGYEVKTITNYLIDKETHASNYNAFRQALKETMQDIVDKKNIYFHCKIGTDRTGTMAYFLEGLLGVSEEDRVQDYELSYFYGLLNRHRFHDYLQDSSINPRFATMHNTYDTNQKIYDYYMAGSTDVDADNTLITNFRKEMIIEKE